MIQEEVPKQEQELTLSFTPERSQFPLEGSSEFLSLSSIQAPFYEETSRAPIQIVAVIDRSGSMGGSKIELVRETLKFVVKQLRSGDNLSIVIYDDSVETILPPTNMTADGKLNADSVIPKITARGGTNLCAGLLQGIDVIQNNRVNEVQSILMFTDGHVNEGIKETAAILEEIKKKEKDGNLGCTVHSFGFGADHALDILKSISEKGNGSYFFVENKDSIADAFANCLAGLLSVVAQNISLTIQATNGAIIQSVSTTFKQSTTDGITTITIGDIQSEERRDILCKLTLPGDSTEGQAKDYINIKITYFNVITSKQEEKVVLGSLLASANYASSPLNIYVDKQKNRIITTEALQNAKQFADKNQYKEAREVLNKAIEILKSSVSANEPYVQSLIRDMNDSLSGLRDPSSYASYGGYTMTTYSMAHGQQRATHSTTAYSTSSRVTVQSRLQDEF